MVYICILWLALALQYLDNTHIHTYAHTYMNTYRHTYTHGCMLACMHTFIHKPIHTHIIRAYTCIRTNVHTSGVPVGDLQGAEGGVPRKDGAGRAAHYGRNSGVDRARGGDSGGRFQSASGCLPH